MRSVKPPEVRREAFINPPARNNQLWQADFSEFEDLGSGVAHYWVKVNLHDDTVTIP